MNKRSLLTALLLILLSGSLFVQAFLHIPACFYCKMIQALSALALISHLFDKRFFTLINTACAVLVHLHLMLIHSFTQAQWPIQKFCQMQKEHALDACTFQIDLMVLGVTWDLTVLAGLLLALIFAFWIYQATEE